MEWGRSTLGADSTARAPSATVGNLSVAQREVNSTRHATPKECDLPN